MYIIVYKTVLRMNHELFALKVSQMAFLQQALKFASFSKGWESRWMDSRRILSENSWLLKKVRGTVVLPKHENIRNPFGIGVGVWGQSISTWNDFSSSVQADIFYHQSRQLLISNQPINQTACKKKKKQQTNYACKNNGKDTLSKWGMVHPPPPPVAIKMISTALMLVIFD